jgi:hypothetical protein
VSKSILLFGAGASHGSNTHGTPPLGNKLFVELCRFNPGGWGSLPQNVAGGFNEDFERGMSAVPRHALTVLQCAMAAYFFKFIPQGDSLYMRLAERIASKNWDGAVCTLNYERLLEISLTATGVQPFVGQPQGTRRAVELCLPHGCCHLFCESVKGLASAITMDGFAVETNGPIAVVSDPEQHRQRVLNDAFPPVMSYFEPSKRTTTGASFIDSQRTRWRELSAGASTIVVVGTQVRCHDRHIWDAIAASPATVVYCSGPVAAAEFKQWAITARGQKRNVVLDGYFQTDFAMICTAADL